MRGCRDGVRGRGVGMGCEGGVGMGCEGGV